MKRTSSFSMRVAFVTVLVTAMTAGQIVPAGATWQSYLEPGPELITKSPDGSPADGYSEDPSVSDDGRYIVFDSYASNLDEAQTGSDRRGVFRHDRVTGITEEVSGLEGAELSRGSRSPRISDDGRYVLFFTGNSYVEEDENGRQDFYVRDMVTGDFHWVDFFGTGEGLGDVTEKIEFAGDGSYLVFDTYNGDLLDTGRVGAYRQVWGYDLASDEATLVSAPVDGYAARGSRDPAISDDGRYIAFITGNSWDESDGNGEQDIYVRDMATGDFRWIDFAGDGSPVWDDLWDVVISGDGSRIAFTTEDGLLPGDELADSDIYTYDLASEEATLVSKPHVNDRGSRSAQITDDGGLVFFYTGQDFAADDVNGGRDLYACDPTTGELFRLPVQGEAPLESFGSSPRGASVALVEGGRPIETFRVSGDGKHIVFDTYDLGGADSNGQEDIFYWQLVDRTLIQGGERVSGRDRYATAAEVSRQSFPAGAETAIIASGENWPDALCGAGLSGAADAPMLLTRGSSLTAETKAELLRLGARNVYLLGGYDAITPEVESALDAVLPGFVWRIGGPDRYATSRAVANRVIELYGHEYDGTVAVTTGLNFPDAVGAAPLSAGLGWPVVLVRPDASWAHLPPTTDAAVVLGGEAAVGPNMESYLKSALGAANVTRKGGANRYETSALVAQYGVDNGLVWDGVGISTGTNFPDALAGGAALGLHRSPMLLTPYAFLHPAPAAKLTANKAGIGSVGFLGGTSALSATVVGQVKAILGL